MKGPLTANIHSFESLATLDGKGIRYEVFFVGCPFRCAYCHNPDTWEGEGLRMTVDELVKKLVRYKPYFGKDGGVTLSGGEVLTQSAFAAQLIPALHDKGINVAVDTCGGVPLTDAVKIVLRVADMVILDVKFHTEDDYRKYCRGSLQTVMNTLAYLESVNARVWIRTVVVPGINDTEEDIAEYARLIKFYKCVERWQLLAFHTMGFAKYRKLGIVNPLEGTPALSKDRLKELQAYADKATEG